MYMFKKLKKIKIEIKGVVERIDFKKGFKGACRDIFTYESRLKLS